MNNKNPFFIVFEGIDGSGKTTQIKKLYQKLIENKILVHLTSEPTNGFIGKVIRDIFLSNKKIDEHTFSALFLADRLDHILNPEYGILNSLNLNISVLCDRYYFSSYAYQSLYVDRDWLIKCNEKCKKLLEPHLTIFFDVSIEESIKRIKKRNQNIDYYETYDNLKKIRNNYFIFFKTLRNKKRIIFINANLSKEQVFVNLWIKITNFFKLNLLYQ